MDEEFPACTKTIDPCPADPIGPSLSVPAGEIGSLDEARYHVDDICHDHENNHEKREAWVKRYSEECKQETKNVNAINQWLLADFGEMKSLSWEVWWIQLKTGWISNIFCMLNM